MIAVTGGAGFIGSAIIWRLNSLGEENIICVDELGQDDKWKNLVGLKQLFCFDDGSFVNFYCFGICAWHNCFTKCDSQRKCSRFI